MSDKKREKTEVQKDNLHSPLWSFIDENQKLITTLGVVTALTFFANNLPIKVFSFALSFMFMALAILVWIEILEALPPATGENWRLILFKTIISLSIIVIIVFWAIYYLITPVITYYILIIIVGGILTIPLNTIWKSLLRIKQTLIRVTLGLLLLGFWLFATHFFAALTTSPVNKLLTSTRQILEDENLQNQN